MEILPEDLGYLAIQISHLNRESSVLARTLEAIIESYPFPPDVSR